MECVRPAYADLEDYFRIMLSKTGVATKNDLIKMVNYL
ncbi:hypothetical protein DFAR_540002 [Desulfarculales bacterium]